MKTSSNRALWGLLNEGTDAVSNLLLAIYIANAVSLPEFGAFSVAYALLPLGLLASRACGSTPFLVRGGRGTKAETQTEASFSLGASLMVGLCLTLTYAALGAFAQDPQSGIFGSFAVVASMLVLQDSYNYVLYQRHQPARAFACNATWLLTQLLLFTSLLLFAPQSIPADLYILAWGAACGASTLVAVWLSLTMPRIRGLCSWFTEHGSMIKNLMLEDGARQSAQQGTVWLIAGLLGLSAVGTFRIAQVALGTTRLVVQGLAPIVLTELVNRLRKEEGARTYAYRVATFNFLIVVTSAAFFLALPDSLGARLLGEGWSTASSTIGFYGLASAFIAIALPMQLGLRALERTSLLALTRILIAGVTPIAVLSGILVGGLGGALAMLAAVCLVDAVMHAILFTRAAREKQQGGSAI